MKEIRLVFTRRPTVASWAIRAATKRLRLETHLGWSHVAIIVGDDNDHIVDSMWGHGVRLRTLRSLLSASGVQYAFGTLPLQETPNEGWLFDQIGKQYDQSALAAFLVPDWVDIRRNWQERDKWFCAELAASWALRHGCNMPEMPRFVSPNDLAIQACLR